MRSFILGLLVVGLVVVLSQPPSAQQSSTVLTPVTIPGLQQPVKVVQDIYGIPHVFAQNALDLYRVVGYLHARDRLFQMDVTRHTANGTLAELIGPSGLNSDIQLRTLGLRRAAELGAKDIPAEVKTEFDAYAEGVNSSIQEATKSGKLPPQYNFLHLTKVDPWSAMDTVAMAKALVFQRSFDVSDIDNTLTYLKYRSVASKLALNGNALFYDDLFRFAPADNAVVIRDAEGKALLNTAASSGSSTEIGINATTARLLQEYYDHIKDVEFLQPAVHRSEGLTGSNWLAIGGKNTESGFPLFFNDPHLGLEDPPLWYEIDEKVKDGAELNVVGTTFAGVPYVVVGHTDKIVWGLTDNNLDVTDIYQETVAVQDGKLFTRFRGQVEPVTEIAQSYRLNQITDGKIDNIVAVPAGQTPEKTQIVPRHGPIVNLDLSSNSAVTIQYSGFYATKEYNTFRIWNRAKNLNDFKEGLKYFDSASLNCGYADVEGNIAYFVSGELPLREDLQKQGKPDAGQPPFFVRDGSGLALHQWIDASDTDPTRALPYEILPFAEMPQTVNPANGFIVSANNDPVGNTIDNDPLNQTRPGGGAFYLAPYNAIGLRAGRITELVRAKIANGGKISIKDMQQIQGDTTTLIGRRLTPFILKALENAKSNDASETIAAVAKDARVAEAVQKYLANWSFNTPTGIREGFDFGDAFATLPDPSAKEITDSVATTLFNVWLSVFTKNIIDNTLNRMDKSMQKPDQFFAIKAVVRLLETFDKKKGKGESGVDFFDAPEVQSEFDENSKRDLMILLSLKEALDLLASDNFAKAFNKSAKLDDYRWGKVHRLTLRGAIHSLTKDFSIPPSGGFDKAEYAEGLPTDGSIETVDVASYSVRDRSDAGFRFRTGPSQRQLVEMNPAGIRALNALPGGESGIPGAKHYSDLLSFWLVNNYLPIYYAKGEIESNSESSQDFVPGK